MDTQEIIKSIESLSEQQLKQVDELIKNFEQNKKEKAKQKLKELSEKGLYTLPHGFKFNRDELHER